MKVLIGCEESQIVTLAFRELGQEAYSCDIQECSGGYPKLHLHMDIFDAIKLKQWDFIGLHPTCTAMTLSGNSTYAMDKPKYQERLDAIEWTINLWNTACNSAKYVYMENPMGAMNTDNRLPKTQIIQPYYFGDKFQKTTCLWLHGLPKLYHNSQETLFNDPITHVEPEERYTWIDKKTGRQKSQPRWYALASQKDGNRGKIRSKTFPMIAQAMAQQWTKHMYNENKTT